MLVPHPSERLVMGMSSIGSMPTPRLQRFVGDAGVTTEKIISLPGRTGHLVVQRGVHIPHVQGTPADYAVTVMLDRLQQPARMDSVGSMSGSHTNTLHGR